mmetsp:Transcript_11252/g.31851  ORF Transcript_11252/g.31851 Transcript_11252/m.31851 type:complete len:378 (-) Transcript_11252:201-1334(-)
MWPRLSRAAARTRGWACLTRSATRSAADDVAILVKSAMEPRALHAASMTKGWESSMQLMILSSNLAPSFSIRPNAKMHSTLTSKSGELNPLTTLAACFMPAGPIFGRDAAAAHAGFRMVAGAFAWTPAMESISDDVSSPVSVSSSASASASESAFSPMLPSAAAAAVFTPTFSCVSSFPISGASEAAFSPRAETIVMAATWTSPSGSASSAGTWLMYFSAASDLLSAVRAAARTRPSLCERSFATAASSAPISPRPVHAATSSGTSLLLSFSLSLPAASVACMAPRDKHAADAKSKSVLPTISTSAGTCAKASLPKPPKAWIAAFFTSLSLLAAIFEATASACTAPVLPIFPSALNAAACTLISVSSSISAAFASYP